MANEKVDVVIVGGGASGILLAAKLGQAGKKVVILEMGPPLALDDLVSSQIWSRRLKWGGVPVVSEGKNPVAHNFQDRKSTRLNSSHLGISYAVFCLDT